jgi:N-acetylglucosamine kinase-like BadF-type ATPase
MKALLGIDQGGSHTWALACDDTGRLLGLGKAPGACHAIQGLDYAMQCVREAAWAALSDAKLQGNPLDLIYAGMTGADWPDEYNQLANAIAALGLSPNVHVTNDSLIALRGGTSQPYGVILVAGSGGNVALRSPRGDEFHYGYFHDGEYQGGGALASAALTAVFRAHTFREMPTLLSEMLCTHFGLESVQALCRAHFEGRLDDGAVLAPLVFMACERGDAVAAKLVRHFGHGYAEMASAALLHFGMADLEVEIVLSGGVFKSQSWLLRETILAEIQIAVPRARLVEARYEPVVGAVLSGLEKLGVGLDGRVLERIESGSLALGLLRGL